MLSAGYLIYNLNWPGGEVGYAYRLVESRTRRHALTLGADAGAWAWPRHDVGLFLLPKVGWRGRHPVGLEGSADLRAGYLHTLPATPSFSVVDGDVVRSHPSYPMFLFGGQLGAGWYLPRVGVTPTVRAGALFSYPTFDSLLIRFHVTVGVEVRL